MIVVTGATGNVGSELVRLLSGEQVTALSRQPAGTTLEGVRHNTGDLADPATLKDAFDGRPGGFASNSPAWAEPIRAHRTAAAPLAAERQVSPDVERLLDRAPRTFAGWAARNAAAFRP